MIYCLIGQTCSGKSTIANMVSKRTGIPRIKTYTTRPRRENESTDEYWFVDNDVFDNEMHNFIDIREYQVANGETWRYAIPYKYIDRNKDYIIVVDTYGYEELCRYFDCYAILIESDDSSLYERAKQRYATEEDMKEFERRLRDDKNKLIEFKNNPKSQYTAFNNNNNSCVPETICGYIIGFIKKDQDNKVDNKINKLKAILKVSYALNIILAGILIIQTIPK